MMIGSRRTLISPALQPAFTPNADCESVFIWKRRRRERLTKVSLRIAILRAIVVSIGVISHLGHPIVEMRLLKRTSYT